MNELNFDKALSLVLAHTILYETKLAYSPNGVVDDARNGGDPPAPTPMQSTAQAMQGYVQYLPQLMNEVLGQMTPAAQATLAAQQATSPQTSQLQADMFSNIGPQINATNQAMDASNKLAGSAADTAVLQGPGAQAARAAQSIDQSVNPEFYDTRAHAGSTIDDLMSGGLTPGEQEAVSRHLAQSNNQMGLTGTPTSTSTVANAMTFGDAARARQMQGVQAATSFLPVSRSIDPTQVALGRPSNGGTSQFLGVNPNPGATGTDTANNMFNQVAGFQNSAMDINAQRRDSMDRALQPLDSLHV